jgi:glycosyltransferase involved in cell wall biosynthesis
MKKVLIFKSKTDLKPVGGPNGYLYNLYSGLQKDKTTGLQIDFLPEYNENSFVSKIINKLKKHKRLAFLLYIFYILHNSGKGTNIDYSQYDIIHFHSTVDMYLSRKKLENFKGKVIITSHSPKACHLELVDQLNYENDCKNAKYAKKLEVIDVYSFNRADYILFPCKEAEECYFNTWDYYKTIKENNKKKYLYLSTGLIPIKLDYSKNDLKKKYNIPEDKLVICYVGRHNEVKGYNSLKRIGSKLLKKRKDVYFLIAGVEEPFKGLENSRWREIGWTNKPHDFIKAADVFVLPNKETYFDLILLEVLSIGTPIIMTNTGGNKFFKKYKNTGYFYYDYDNYSEFENALKSFESSDKEVLIDNNHKIFDKYFADTVFASKYVDMYKNINKK